MQYKKPRHAEFSVDLKDAAWTFLMEFDVKRVGDDMLFLIHSSRKEGDLETALLCMPNNKFQSPREEGDLQSQ